MRAEKIVGNYFIGTICKIVRTIGALNICYNGNDKKESQ